ncbi:reverse transcriptase domain-containing protein [Tanacetum coccineum]
MHHHPILSSEIPPPPFLLPSTAHRDDIPEADMPLRKRACFSSPASGFEVGESSVAAAARQARHALNNSVDYGFIDTVDASICAFESRAMTTIGEVNERVTDLAITQSSGFITDERERERRYFHLMASSYEREAVIARQAWSRSEDRSTALEASIRTLKKIPPKKTTTTPMTDVIIKTLIAQGVANALAEYEAHRSSGNGNDSHDSGSNRRTEHATCECTYSDFLKCQPLSFKGTEGVVGLTYWFKKMEYTVSHEVAYGMTWKILKKMMIDKYYPRGEIKKPEIELWNLKVKGTDVLSYNQRFQELALMCGRMFLEESDEVKKYVGGLPDIIQRSVMVSRPKTMQDAIEFAIELMDQKIRTFADRQAENKRKLDDN